MDEKKWKDPSPWVPMTRAIDLKVTGKLCEEAGELVVAASLFFHENLRGKNLTALEDEIADVRAGIHLAVEHFNLDTVRLNVLGSSLSVVSRDIVPAAGNLISALSRCMIQGIDEAHPETGKTNREWLHETLAMVQVVSFHVIDRFNLDKARICERVEFKKTHLRRWHQMLEHVPGSET